MPTFDTDVTQADAFPRPLRVPAVIIDLDAEANTELALGSRPGVYVGAGVPTIAAANGSIYRRTDAPDADNFEYGRIGGAWVSLKSATA